MEWTERMAECKAWQAHAETPKRPRVWLVIQEDRHADMEVTPFASEAAAVEYAEQTAASFPTDHDPEDMVLTSDMRRQGWVYYYTYGESDSIRVIWRHLRGAAS